MTRTDGAADDVRRHLAACRACRILHDYAHARQDASLLDAAEHQLREHLRYERSTRRPPSRSS